MNSTNNKGSSKLVVIIGVVLIIASCIVAISTVSGTFSLALKNEIIPSMTTYFSGMALAIILLIIGIIVVAIGIKM